MSNAKGGYYSNTNSSNSKEYSYGSDAPVSSQGYRQIVHSSNGVLSNRNKKYFEYVDVDEEYARSYSSDSSSSNYGYGSPSGGSYDAFGNLQ